MAEHSTPGNKSPSINLPSPPALTKKAKAKAILWLVGELVKVGIMQKVMYEFKKQKLDIIYQKEIAEWFTYLDQQEFSEELEEKMMIEVERYMEGKKTIEELIKETFPDPKWEIEFIRGMSYNYFFKAVLGYA